jgi:hypothetical protein
MAVMLQLQQQNSRNETSALRLLPYALLFDMSLQGIALLGPGTDEPIQLIVIGVNGRYPRASRWQRLQFGGRHACNLR